MAEQLQFTETRLFVESSPGNATPSGDVVIPPFNDAATTRQVIYLEEKTTPFRHKEARTPLLEWFSLTFTSHVTPEFLAFLLEPHLRGGTTLDFRAPLPTFALQIEAEDGDLIQFAGLALSELQISLVARGVVELAVTMNGFTRTTGVALEAATADVRTEPLAGEACDIVGKSGALVSRAADRLDARSAEIFLSRTAAPAQFDHDGNATRHDLGPWRLFGEILTPSDAFTEAATAGFVDGSAAFFLGESGSDLQLLLDGSVRWISNADPVKADDFRDFAVIFEAEADSAGSILTLANNL